MSEDLLPGHFPFFFQDVHGQSPFPWQQRLASQVLESGEWPKVIDLPTGSGKTAVLDVAVFALALRPADAPRRIVFVVDRRVVVHQACKRALRILDRIEAGDTPILRRVRQRLETLSPGEPLGCAALRGGVPVDEWSQRPDQPWVAVSTVDQFGSRLLFRGQGVKPTMWPIHAGLAGNDCLVILDELHPGLPFAETLAQVGALRCWGPPGRYHAVEMSATPTDSDAEPFRLDPVADLERCAELRRRVQAAKEAELVPLASHDLMPGAVLKIVKSVGKLESRQAIRTVGVVVNRVRMAREVHRTLRDRGYTTFLVTGRMRPLDRLDTVARIGSALDPDGAGRGEGLTIVVSTQAIEVGADFTFDALITECAPIDSLRQRFGRLDRRGRYSSRTGRSARAWIVGCRPVVSSVKATWAELERRSKDGPIDVGPASLQDFPSEALAPRARAPRLLKTHMDAWTQTSPLPIVQPSVDWFLRGLGRRCAPDVSIVWRWDRSEEALRLVPPRPSEFLPVPIDAAKSWLSSSGEVDTADGDRGADRETDWVRWMGFDSGPECIPADAVDPGDILIVDPRRGGLRAANWDPSSREHVADLGDMAQGACSRRATLRLDPRLPGIVSPPLPSVDPAEGSSNEERVGDWLHRWSADSGQRFDWERETLERLGDGFEIDSVGLGEYGSDHGYYVLTERHGGTKGPIVDTAAMDGSDQSGSLIGTGVTLSRHLDGVRERAGHIAESLGFPSELRGDLRLAGLLHDLGKVDRRFQAELVGGDPVELEMQREPLAKSLRRVARGGHCPTGMRHEVASVAMAASNPGILEGAHDKDLVLYLVGTHHGWGRPLLPIVEDPEPRRLTCTLAGHLLEANSDLVESTLALDMADRFWRLVERYGYHGLAWFEAILRLADHQQTGEEAEHHEPDRSHGSRRNKPLGLSRRRRRSTCICH